MNKSINLLVPEVDTTKIRKRLETLRFVSLFVLLTIVTLSVSFFFLVLISPLPALRTQESTALAKLRDLRSTSGKLFLIKERLGKISSVIDTRPEYDVMVEQVMHTIPGGVVVESISIDQKSLTFTVSSSSLFSVNSFITQMQELREQDLFTALTMSDLKTDSKDPKYLLTIQATF